MIPHDFFARSLRFDRERFDLTEQNVADKVGISLEAYLDIESGANMTPELEIVHALADLFEMDRGLFEIGFEEALRIKLEQGVKN